MIVRPISAADTRPMRLEILRPEQPPEVAVYPGDDAPTTRHFGAFVGGDGGVGGDGRLVGIASLYAEPRPDGPAPGWRLRGMATDPSMRRQGVGHALLAACVEHVVAHGGGELWANARLPAVHFYASAGFEVVGDEFDIPGIGPHFVMRRLLP